MHQDLALFEWPSGPELGGPRLLGRISDPDLVQAVRDRITAQHEAEMRRIERGSGPPAIPLGAGPSGGPDAA